MFAIKHVIWPCILHLNVSFQNIMVKSFSKHKSWGSFVYFFLSLSVRHTGSVRARSFFHFSSILVALNLIAVKNYMKNIKSKQLSCVCVCVMFLRIFDSQSRKNSKNLSTLLQVRHSNPFAEMANGKWKLRSHAIFMFVLRLFFVFFLYVNSLALNWISVPGLPLLALPPPPPAAQLAWRSSLSGSQPRKNGNVCFDWSSKIYALSNDHNKQILRQNSRKKFS